MSLTKTCSKCKRTLPLNHFYIYNDKPTIRCKECLRQYTREYYRINRDKCMEYQIKNKEKINNFHKKYYYTEKNKEWRRKHIKRIRETHTQWRNELRLKVLNYISDGVLRCAICGFSDVRILQIDHIEGGGSYERRINGVNLSTLFNKILKLNQEDAKKGYQILCPNCNWIKKVESVNERGGSCAIN